MENNEEKIKSWSKQLLLAMNVLVVKRIVHWDIKPENILLDEIGWVKLADFGLAKKKGQSKFSTKEIAGTRRYLSPELSDGITQSEKSDVWAFGVLVLELAYGSSSYKDSEILRMDSFKIRKEFKTKCGYSSKMVEFLAKCLEYKYSDRAKVEDLLQDKWFYGVNNYPCVPIVEESKIPLVPA